MTPHCLLSNTFLISYHYYRYRWMYISFTTFTDMHFVVLLFAEILLPNTHPKTLKKKERERKERDWPSRDHASLRTFSDCRGDEYPSMKFTEVILDSLWCYFFTHPILHIMFAFSCDEVKARGTFPQSWGYVRWMHAFVRQHFLFHMASWRDLHIEQAERIFVSLQDFNMLTKCIILKYLELKRLL